MKKIIIAFSILVGIIIFLFVAFFITFLTPVKDFKENFVVVHKGDNFNKIYDSLGIKYSVADKIYLKITGNASKAKLGSYKFNGKVSRLEIINKIVIILNTATIVIKPKTKGIGSFCNSIQEKIEKMVEPLLQTT